MKNLNKISFAFILGLSLTSCGSFESKYCAEHNNTSTSSQMVVEENEILNTSKSSNMPQDSLIPEINSEEQLVCLLSGAEQAERKQLLQEEIFSQVKKVEEVESGYVFYFKYEENFLIKMTDYIIAENNCCPFFTFETSLHSKDDVSLKITGSEKAKAMIKMTLIDR